MCSNSNSSEEIRIKREDASIIGSCIGGSEYVIGTSSREPKKTGPNVDVGQNSNDIADEITLEARPS